MESVHDHLIRLHGLRFHFREWPCPKAGAQDLVLLHGFTGHARSWDAFAQAMSDTFRVLALDQRGHGETEWGAPDQYGTPYMVADLEAFVAALGLNRFVLLGLSMGGSVAIHYAGKQPAALERLVIVDISPEIGVSGLSRINQGVQAKDIFSSPEEAFEAARAANALPPEAHHRQRVVNNLMRLEDGTWTYRYDRALRDPNNPRQRPTAEEGWRAVARINVPTLLIRGELSDILAPAHAARMAKDIADCQLVEVSGSGHAVPLDKPDGLLKAVRACLVS
jgi:pimeloyl-ACP methyl ester carboxylesterase